jgi:hypothetical protein
MSGWISSQVLVRVHAAKFGKGGLKKISLEARLTKWLKR